MGNHIVEAPKKLKKKTVLSFKVFTNNYTGIIIQSISHNYSHTVYIYKALPFVYKHI